MNQKEETRKRLEEEIFKSCKRENRNPDSAEIAILSNIEDQRLFDKLMPNLDKWLQDRCYVKGIDVKTAEKK
jgi:hypothetical protein